MKIQLGSFSIPRGLTYVPYSSATLESFVKNHEEYKGGWEFLAPLYSYEQLPGEGLDILGLTCYIWSQDHCDSLAKSYKEKNPETLIIYGGPNIPVSPEQWEEFQAERPFVDVFVAGSGEEIFLEILNTYPDLKPWYKLEKNNKTYRYKTPMVYLDGGMDRYLQSEDPKFCAILETNRGCPFKCAYCDWGDATDSVVSKYDEDVVFSTVKKILESPGINGIKIIDANWGMYERDLRLTEYMRDHKREDFFVSLCGTAKNSTKYVPEISRIFYENNFEANDAHATPMKLGIQTWNEKTLKYNDRGNIKTKYIDFMINYFNEWNIPYHSELILGLPGETPETWLETLDKDYSYQPKTQSFHALEAVPNMPLLLKYGEEYRIELQAFYADREAILKSHNRNFHRNRGLVYDDFEVVRDRSRLVHKRMIRSCFSYSSDDLLKMYDYTWWMNTFSNSGLLKGISRPSEEILEFFENLDRMPFWKARVEAHRDHWREAMVEGKVRTAGAIRYWFHTMFRSDELMKVAENLEQAQDEMGRGLIPVRKSLRLYDYDFSI